MSQQYDAEWIAEVEAREAAATPGPWERVDGADYTEIHGFSDDPTFPVALVAETPDADFIAHSRDDIPRLLSLVKQQQEEIARLEDLLEKAVAEQDHLYALSKWTPLSEGLPDEYEKVIVCIHDKHYDIGYWKKAMSNWGNERCWKCAESKTVDFFSVSKWRRLEDIDHDEE